MANDPVTLIVALNKQNEARGTLYMDDGATFNYKTKSEFSLVEFDFSKNKLTGHLKSKPGFPCKSWLERVVIYGVEKAPKEAKIVSPMSGEETLKVSYENKVLTVRRPGVNICATGSLPLSCDIFSFHHQDNINCRINPTHFSFFLFFSIHELLRYFGTIETMRP